MILPLAIAAAAILSWSSGPLTCTNAGLAEIQCTGKDCSIEADPESFTPLRLWVSDGLVEVCAYSGCFSGATAEPARQGDLLILSGSVASEADTASREDLVLVIDEKEGWGIVRWGGFANPLRCSATRQSAQRN